MGQIDWAAVEKMSAANHALYAAAYEGNETQLAAALIDGADPRSVAQWVEGDDAREFLLTQAATSRSR